MPGATPSVGSSRRRTARVAGLTALALLATVPPGALAVTTLLGSGSAHTLTVQDHPPLDAAFGARAVPSPATSSPRQSPAPDRSPAPSAVPVDPALQRAAVAWMSGAIPRGATFVAAESTARALRRVRGTSVRTAPERPASGSWNADVVVDDAALRAAAGDKALAGMPLLARFGKGAGRIDVRRRTSRADTRAATRTLLSGAAVVADPGARQVALDVGLDARLLQAMRGFTAGSNTLRSIGAFPATAAERAVRAPRRAVEIRSINGHTNRSGGFAAQAQQLKRHLTGLPPAQRPQYAALETRGGAKVFVVRYAVAVGPGR